MKIIITIDETELELKKAIAMGWNERFPREKLTHKDIADVSNDEDIVAAFPYIDLDKIEIEIEE